MGEQELFVKLWPSCRVPGRDGPIGNLCDIAGADTSAEQIGDPAFDGKLVFILQLASIGRENLNTVIVEWIVGSRNHHAAGVSIMLDEKRDSGCRNDAGVF